VVAGKAPFGTTPVEVAKKLHFHADRALGILDGLSHGGNKELRLTMGDIRAMALLGKYYAHKIQAATSLALFRKTREEVHQDAAVEELIQAAAYWRRYASTALGQYKNPLWTNRVGHVDWRSLFDQVLQDITIAGGTPRLPFMRPTEGGIILEAETADFAGLLMGTDIDGYTGTGYLETRAGSRQSHVRWTFDAPEAAAYVLELRYALKGRGQYPCQVTLNGKNCADIVCWNTGGDSTWAWDRAPVLFQKGPNNITLSPTGHLLIDHLNVLFGGEINSMRERN
jgi:hypothetical protein